MEYLSDLKHEREYLLEIEHFLADNIDLLHERLKTAFELLREVSQLYSEGEAGFYMEIPAYRERYEIAKKELEDNEKAKDSPYFGKVIFSFDDEENGVGDNTFYLGKRGISDVSAFEKKLVITDWRAPVAEIYYSSKLGRTSYNAPKGNIGVDLKLKTTMKIKGGELINLYDAEVVTNDELLSEYLSQNKNTVLNEIIATIQEDQNKIIRRPLSTNLIVQGVAGSGKTTVALHRIAYLLYNYKEQLQFNNVCLVAANKLFLGYITGMLPELDVPAIKQCTIEELFISSIKSYLPKLIRSTVQAEYRELTVEAVYSNKTYVKAIEEFMAEKTKEIFDSDAVSFLAFDFLTREEIDRIAFADNISLVEKGNILDKKIKERILLKKLEIINYICQNKYDEAVIKATDEQFSLKGSVILEDVLFNSFLTFCGKYKGVFSKRVKSYTVNKMFAEFIGKQAKSMQLNDLACYLQLLVFINGTDNLSDIRHIVIDEAQDFSIAIYSALKTAFPKATFTVVGDIMQNIRLSGLESWDTLKSEIFNEHTEYASLIKSYRNTIEISEFAQSAVKRLTGKTIDIEPIIRHGDKPVIHSYVTPPERLFMLIKALNGFKNSGYEMNAVICKTECEAEKLYMLLAKEKSEVKLLNPDGGSLEQGSYIISLPNAKGLEFDCVVVWDYDSYEKGEVNQLYVALTRALHRLEIFSNRVKSNEVESEI